MQQPVVGRSALAFSARLNPVTAAVAAALLAAYGAPRLVHAAPTGEQVVGGQASVSRPDAQTTIVNQATQRAAIDWNGFSINVGEAVIFRQPGVSSIALNRVIGPNVSTIAGSLQANGQVFLINPSGILFSKGASVDVAGLVASTLNISNNDFMSGRYVFSGLGGNVTVEKGANIRAGERGYVALLANQVSNSGTLTASNGTVALGAGSDMVLDFHGDGLLSLKVNSAAAGAKIDHNGLIVADGGRVIMSAAARNALLDTVLNVEGIVQARGAVERNGSIYLEADSGITRVAGTLDVSNAQGKGGEVRVLGENVGLFDKAKIDASGTTGGGTVLVGGDLQGKNGDVANARRTYMGPDATINADATVSGDGGKVIVWADDTTQFYGNITARGGAQGGNGGFVETSGKMILDGAGLVDASAPQGRAGEWLLDPFNLTISNNAPSNVNAAFDAIGSGANVQASTIQSALNGGNNVTITTGSTGAETGNVTIFGTADSGGAVDINKTSGAGATLTIRAANDITMNAGAQIRSTGSGNALNVVLDADRDASGAGAITIASATIQSNGGAITLGGGADPATSAAVGTNGVTLNGATLQSGAGAISIRGAGSAGGFTHYGVLVYNSSVVESTSGKIDIIGTGGTDSGQSYGVYLVGANTRVSSTDGNISITGTGGGGTVGTSRVGVFVEGALVRSAGAGDILIKGTGGGDAASSGNTGITLFNGGRVQSTSSASNAGSVTLEGTGGAGTSFNSGVLVNGSSSTVSSARGDISITGIGAGTTSSNRGVFVLNSGKITAAGEAKIVVQGTAGGATDLNSGVEITGGAAITTVDGGITVTGTGNSAATGTFNAGVSLSTNALVSTTGSGNVSITGTGGAGTTLNAGIVLSTSAITSTSTAAGAGAISLAGTGGAGTSSNYGVDIAGNGTTVTTVGGGITIAGNGSSAATGANNYGVSLSSSALVSTTGTGNISITGTGGAGTIANVGILVTGSADITSASTAAGAGTITLTGTGGAGTTGNTGVQIGSANINLSAVASVVGDIAIDGTGGGSGAGAGVTFTAGNKVESTGAAKISVTGKAANNGTGIDMNSGFNVSGTSAGGSVVFTADSMNLAGTISAPLQTVTLRPASLDRPVSLGTETTALSLTNTELNTVTADTLIVGRDDAAAVVNMNVASALTFSNAKHIELRTPGSFTAPANILKGGSFDGSLTIRANNDITFSSGADVGLAGGAGGKFSVVLNSDRDASGAGAITVNSGTVINSNGGDITLGGGADPSSTAARPVALFGAQVNAGAGNVSIRGNNANGKGVELLQSSVQTTTGAIEIVGQGGTGIVQLQTGIFLDGSSTISSTSGAITLTGTGGNGSGSVGGVNHGIAALSGTVKSTSGHVTLDGTGGVGGGAGIFLRFSTNVSTDGSGNVTLLGTGGLFGSGVFILDGAQVSAASGNVVITGEGHFDTGLFLRDASIGSAASSGDILLRSLAGSGVTLQDSVSATVVRNDPTAGAYVTIRADGGGTVSQSGTGTIATGGLRLLSDGASTFTLSGAGNAVTTLAADVQGPITLVNSNALAIGKLTTNDGSSSTSTAGITTKGGTLEIVNAGAITSDVDGAINTRGTDGIVGPAGKGGDIVLRTTAAGAIALNAPITADGGFAVPGQDNGSAGVVTLITQSGAITVDAISAIAGTGGNDGTGTAGSIQLKSAGGDIKQNDNTRLTAANLKVISDSSVELLDLNNDVNVLAAKLTGAGKSFEFRDGNELTIGSIATNLSSLGGAPANLEAVSGIVTTPTAAASDASSVYVQAFGSITVSNAIDTSGSAALAGSGLIAGRGGDVTLYTTGAGVPSGAAIAQNASITARGGAASSDAETAGDGGTVTIVNTDGAIILHTIDARAGAATNDALPGFDGAIQLGAVGDITQTTNTALSAGSLLVVGGNATLMNPGNAISRLAAMTTGNLSVNTTLDLEVDGLTPTGLMANVVPFDVNGIQTSGGNVTLVTGGSLSVLQPIDTSPGFLATDQAGGSVVLEAIGDIVIDGRAAGAITTDGKGTGNAGEIFIHAIGVDGNDPPTIFLSGPINAKGGESGNGGVVTVLNQRGDIVVDDMVDVSRGANAASGFDGKIQLQANGFIDGSGDFSLPGLFGAGGWFVGDTNGTLVARTTNTTGEGFIYLPGGACSCVSLNAMAKVAFETRTAGADGSVFYADSTNLTIGTIAAAGTLVAPSTVSASSVAGFSGIKTVAGTDDLNGPMPLKGSVQVTAGDVEGVGFGGPPFPALYTLTIDAPIVTTPGADSGLQGGFVAMTATGNVTSTSNGTITATGASSTTGVGGNGGEVLVYSSGNGDAVVTSITLGAKIDASGGDGALAGGGGAGGVVTVLNDSGTAKVHDISALGGGGPGAAGAGGALELAATHGITQETGTKLLARSLLVMSGESTVLTNPDNNVARLAALVLPVFGQTTPGSFSYNNAGALTITRVQIASLFGTLLPAFGSPGIVTDAGDVTITAGGTLNVTSGISTSPFDFGPAGGNVSLTSATGVTSGPLSRIVTGGGTAQISVTGAGAIALSGRIDTSGGSDSFGTGAGVAGGAVTLMTNDGPIAVASINTSGGSADVDGEAGAAAGALTFNVGGSNGITLSGDITMRGGDGLAAGNAGSGASLTLPVATTLGAGIAIDTLKGAGAGPATSGDITFASTLAGTTAYAQDLTLDGRNLAFNGVVGATPLGTVTIGQASDVTVAANLTAKALLADNGGGAATIASFDSTGRAISTRGAADTNGGDVRITTSGALSVGDLDTRGGAASGASGFNGGAVVLKSGAGVTVAAIDASASAGASKTGTSGDITIAAGTAIASSGATLTGNAISLTAATGIGSSSPLNTAANTVSAINSTSGNVNIVDVDSVSISGSNAGGGAFNVTSGGTLTVANAHLTAGSTGAGTVTLQADEMVLNGDVTGNGGVTLRPNTAGTAISLDSGTAGLDLTNPGLAKITTGGFLTIGADTAGSITIGGGISAPSTWSKLSLRTGGAIVDNNGSGADITAGDLALRAGSGIGAGNPLETAVTNLAFTNSGANGVAIANTGALTVKSLDGITASSGGSGAIELSASSPLTIAANLTNAGPITLTATGSALSGDNLTINDTVLVRSTGGNVTLNAGENVVLEGTSAVESQLSGGTVRINAGAEADLANGGSITGSGRVSASNIVLDSLTGVGSSAAARLNTSGGTLAARSRTSGDVFVGASSAVTLDSLGGVANGAAGSATYDVTVLGSIVVTGDVNAAGAASTVLTTSGESKITGTGTVYGSSVTLDSGGGIGVDSTSRLNTSAGSLTARTRTLGGIFIAEADGVTLETTGGGIANGTATSGAYDLRAGGDIAVNGSVTTRGGAVRLETTSGAIASNSSGAIATTAGQNTNVDSGRVDLIATTTIDLNAAIATQGARTFVPGNNGGAVTLTGPGGISVAEIDSSGGRADSIDGGSAGAITFNNTAVIVLRGNLTSRGGNAPMGTPGSGAAVTLNGPVALANDVMIDTRGGTVGLTAGASGNVTFSGALDSQAAGSERALVVNTGAVTTFGGIVGGTTPLLRIETDAGGSTQINTTAVTTSGGQVYGDPVTIGGASGASVALTGSLLSFGGTLAAGNHPLTLTGNEIDFAGNVTGSSALVLQPFGDAVNVNVAAALPVKGELNLTSTEIGFLQDGFSGITIGRATGTGLTTVNAVTFNDPITIRQPAGAGRITIAGNLAADGAIALAAGSGGVALDANVSTLSQDRSTTPGVNAFGTDITINSAGDVSGTGTLTTGDAVAGGTGAAITASSGSIAVASSSGNIRTGEIRSGAAMVVAADGDDTAAAGSVSLTAVGIGTSAAPQVVTIGLADAAGGVANVIQGVLNLTSTGAGSAGDIFVSSTSSLLVNNLGTRIDDRQTIDLRTTANLTFVASATDSGIAGSGSAADGDALVVSAPGASITFGRSMTAGSITVDASGAVAVNADLATSDVVTTAAAGTDAISGSIAMTSTGNVSGTGQLSTGEARADGSTLAVTRAESGGIQIAAGGNLSVGRIRSGSAAIEPSSGNDTSAVGVIALTAQGIGSDASPQLVLNGSARVEGVSSTLGFIDLASTGAGSGGDIFIDARGPAPTIRNLSTAANDRQRVEFRTANSTLTGELAFHSSGVYSGLEGSGAAFDGDAFKVARPTDMNSSVAFGRALTAGSIEVSAAGVFVGGDVATSAVDTGTSGANAMSGDISITSVGGPIAGIGRLTTGAARADGSAGAANAQSGSITVTGQTVPGTPNPKTGVTPPPMTAPVALAPISTGSAQIVNADGNDSAATGAISISATGIGASASRQHVAIGTASGATNTNGSFALSTDGVGAAGDAFVTIDASLRAGALTATGAGARIDVNRSGASVLTLNGNIATNNGAVVLDAPVTLASNVTVGAGSGDITFGTTVDGPFGLTANSSGTTTFSGAVGASTPLASLTTDTEGTTAINAASMSTTGDQTYGDAVRLGANATLATGSAGSATFSTVDSDATPRSLTVIGGAVASFGNIGATAPLADLDVTAGSIQLLGPTINVNGGAAAQTVTFDGPVQLRANVTINTDRTGTADTNVTFVSTIASDVTPRSLNVTAGSAAVTFDGNAGSANALADLDVTAGTINLNAATFNLNGGSTAQTINFNGPVVLGVPTVTINTDRSGASDSHVVFGSTVDADNSANNRALVVTAGSGMATFADSIGAGANGALADFDVTASAIALNGSVLNVDGGAVGGNTATLTGPVTLGANLAIDTDRASGTDNSLTFGSTITGPARALAITAGGGSFSVAGTTNVASLDAIAGNAINLGPVTSGGNVTLTSDHMALGTIGAAGQIVTLRNFTNAQPILLGGDSASILALDATEMNGIDAQRLIIGRNDAGSASGAITIASDVAPQVATLHLLTGSELTGTAGGIVLRAGALAIDAAGRVNITDAQNSVGTLAANQTGGSAFTFTNAGALTVGMVGGIAGITAPGVTITAGGNLTLDAAVDAGTGIATLTSTEGAIAGSATVTGSAVALDSATGVGGGAGARVNVDTARLGARSRTGGGVFVNALGSVTLDSGVSAVNNFAAGAAGYDVVSGGAIVVSDVVSTATVDNAATAGSDATSGGITLVANGTVGGDGALFTGRATAGGGTATSGSITINAQRIGTNANSRLNVNTGPANGGATNNEGRFSATLTGTTAADGLFLSTGSGVRLAPLTLTAAGAPIVIGSAPLSLSISRIALTGDLASNGGAIDLRLPVHLASDVVVTANGGAVTFGGAIESPLTPHSLRVTTSALTTFGGVVGSASPLSSLVVNGGGTAVLNGGSVATTGDQTYTDAIALGTNTTLTGANGTFAAGVAGNDFDLTLNFSGPTTIAGASFTGIRNLASGSGGGTRLSGTISTSGTQNYGGPVTLTGAATLDAGANAITFGGSVDGTQNLTVNTSGATTFNGAVGATTPLASLTTDAGGTTAINGASVRTTGNQTYNDAVTLAAHTTLAGATPTFGGGIGGGGFDVTLSFSGVTAIDGATFTGIRTLTTDSGGTTVLTGALTTTGNQAYGENVALAGTTALSAGAGSVTFAGTLESPATPRALTITSGNVVRFNGAVGGNGNPLGSMTASGSSIQIDGGAVTTTGSQTYNNVVVIGANTRLDSTAGNISFGAALDADAAANNRTLLVSAPTGTVTFSGSVGALAAFADFDVVAGPDTIVFNGPAAQTVNVGSGGDGMVSFSGNVRLDQSLRVNTAGNGVTFANGIETGGATNRSLTIDAASGNVTLMGNVGNATPLALLDVNGSTIAFNAKVVGEQIAITAQQLLLDPTLGLIQAMMPFSGYDGPAALTLRGPASGGMYGADGSMLRVDVPGLLLVTPNQSRSLPAVWLQGDASRKPFYQWYDDPSRREVIYNARPIGISDPQQTREILRQVNELEIADAASLARAEAAGAAREPELCNAADAKDGAAALSCGPAQPR